VTLVLRSLIRPSSEISSAFLESVRNNSGEQTFVLRKTRGREPLSHRLGKNGVSSASRDEGVRGQASGTP